MNRLALLASAALLSACAGSGSGTGAVPSASATLDHAATSPAAASPATPGPAAASPAATSPVASPAATSPVASPAATSSPANTTATTSPAARPTPARTAAQRPPSPAATPQPIGAGAEAYVSAAFDGQHFGLVTSTTLPTRVSITATDVAGHTHSSVVRTGDIGYYYAYLAVGPAGIYASTSVIRRFTLTPDEVIRIDRTSLRVLARRTLSARGQVVVLADRVYLLGESDVQRLDPLTLQTVARFAHPNPADPQVSPGYFWSLTLGAGELWAAYGDAPHSDVTQLDPTSLRASPGTWPVPPGQGESLVGTRTGVWLVTQPSVSRLLAGGSLSRPVALADIAVGAIADREAVLVLTGADHPLTLVQADGSSKTLPLRDTECRQLTPDGQAAWMYCGDHDLVRFALP